jgi:FMN reductase
MSLLRLVGFSGNTRRPSRTRTLVEAIGRRVTRHRAVHFELHDLVDAGPGIGAIARDQLPPAVAEILAAIESADALIVGTPVYKGSYTGLFKHLVDFIEPAALTGKPVVLTATGGGTRHALIAEHQLRPLFGFFGALSIPTSVYASDEDFHDGFIVGAAINERIGSAAAELAALADVARSGSFLEKVA